MAKALDEDKLNSPDLKILDINNPPTKDIPYQAYPKMLYLYPKDKTKEHRVKVVQDESEHDAAEKQGWKTKPHIPAEPVEDLSDEFEAAGAEDAEPLDSMSREDALAEVKRLGITTVDGRSKTEAIIAALKENA